MNIPASCGRNTLKAGARQVSNLLTSVSNGASATISVLGLVAVWTAVIVGHAVLAGTGALIGAVGIALMTARLQSESTVRKGGAL